MMTLNYLMVLIQCHIFKIISSTSQRKHETLPSNPPIHIYVNKINNILVFKIKDGHKLELQAPKTKKVFGSIKKLIDKTRNGENAPSIKVLEVVSVRCNLVENHY